MGIWSNIARTKSRHFDAVLQLCAIGVFFTLVLTIAVYFIFGEWITVLPGG
jgi:hypothetical protein